jgi:SAM-dependent methyltransferase
VAGNRGPATSAFRYEAALRKEAALVRGRPGDGIDLDAAAKDLLALQRGLTGDRKLIGERYMDERVRLSSYLLFYWPVSYAQARAMLRMAGIAPRSGAVRVLDLGSGPSPCGLAAADHLAGIAPGAPLGAVARASLVACDPSALALESAGRLAAAAGCDFAAVPGWDAAASAVLPDGPFDLIVLGHVVNELWSGEPDRIARRARLLDRCFELLAPDGALLLLEPALLSTGRDALALRDALVSAGRRVLAPCVRSGPCPALQAEGQTCHSDFAWEVPRAVRELSARTGLDKGLVKTTGFAFAAGRPAEDARFREAAQDRFRVVSDPMVNKAGRVRYLVCGERGRFPLSAKRGEGFPAERTFFSLKRSDLVRIASPAVRETGEALGPGTEIEKL